MRDEGCGECQGPLGPVPLVEKLFSLVFVSF